MIAILIVDLQAAFVGEVHADLPKKIEAHLARHAYDHVLATRFSNAPGSLFRSALDWQQCGPHDPDRTLLIDAAAFDKSGYGLGGTGVIDHLRALGIERIDLVGMDTDACVLAVAFDLWDAGIVPCILPGLCASSGGADLHHAALMIANRQFGQSQGKER